MPKKNPNEKVLPSVLPNAALEMRFRKRLLTLIAEMNRSVTYWLSVQFKDTPPALEAQIAEDALPANELQKTMKALSKKWISKFDTAAAELADYYSENIADRSDAQLRAILRKSGFSVKFKMTKAQRDIIAATTHESVALIKSIPAKYLADVEGDVMRAVQSGGDLGSLSKKIEKNYGVTQRRARTIARDQNAKATAALNRGRQAELGITEAIWKHSHAGKTPRPTHLKMNGKRYDVNKGMYDPAVDDYILPGALINCRCTSRSIIKGFI